MFPITFFPLCVWSTRSQKNYYIVLHQQCCSFRVYKGKERNNARKRCNLSFFPPLFRSTLNAFFNLCDVFYSPGIYILALLSYSQMGCHFTPTVSPHAHRNSQGRLSSKQNALDFQTFRYKETSYVFNCLRPNIYTRIWDVEPIKTLSLTLLLAASAALLENNHG